MFLEDDYCIDCDDDVTDQSESDVIPFQMCTGTKLFTFTFPEPISLESGDEFVFCVTISFN